jgi:hypothetical protein
MILQKERDMEIPDKPPVDLPQHRHLPIFGTLTGKKRMLDRKSLESEGKIREAATKLPLEKEARGDESGMYAYLQPPEMPSLDELVGDELMCVGHIMLSARMRKGNHNTNIDGAKGRCSKK